MNRKGELILFLFFLALFVIMCVCVFNHTDKVTRQTHTLQERARQNMELWGNR